MMRIHDSNSGPAWLLPLLALVVLTLAACGGNDNIDLPNATVREGEQTPTPPTPTPPTPAPGPEKKATPPAPPAPDTVIVTVDGAPITQGEIDKEAARMVFGGRPVPPAQMAMLRQRFGAQTEKILVERKLLENALAKEPQTVTDEELAGRWKDIEASFPKGVTREMALARSGMSQEKADVEIRHAIELEKLLEKHAPTDPVTDEAAKKHYDANLGRFEVKEQVRARHILLKLPKGASEEDKAAAKQKLEDIRAELGQEGGRSFEELAREYSACPSGKKGGDLDMFAPGAMVPEFDKLAFSLEPGVVSEPFTTPFGYHILEVTEKKPGRTKPFDEVKDGIKKSLGRGARQLAQTKYIKTLREAAEIVRVAPKANAPKK